MSSKHIVVGSGSATRAEMLRTQGLDVVVEASGAEENLDKSQYADPRDYVRATSRLKMELMLQRYTDKPFDAIITADTVVISDEGAIFEKPSDPSELQSFLRAFSGCSHTIFTAAHVAFGTQPGAVEQCEDSARMHFARLPEDAIVAYSAVCEQAYTMSGGYSINGLGGSFIERVEGDVNAVRGLPLAKLCALLHSHFAAAVKA